MGQTRSRPFLLIIMLASLGWQPVLAQSSQDRCASEVIPLLQQANFDLGRYAPVFGCWPDGSGNWSMLSVDVTADEESYGELDTDGMMILDAVDRMSLDAAFQMSVRFDRSRSIAIVLGPGWVDDEIDVSDASIGTSSSQYWMNNYRDAYEESIIEYLTRTREQEIELTHYLVWYMSERDLVLSSLSNNMNPMARYGYLDLWGYERAPWPWQLANPYAIQQFVDSDYFRENLQPSAQNSTEFSETYLTIALAPNTAAAQPGDTVRLEIQYTRLQGVTDAAYMASSQGGTITNLPLSQIDPTGALACSPGHDSDLVSPRERATSLHPDDLPALPTYLDVELSADAVPGDQVSVCFELVGFGGAGKELFSWNTSATIFISN